MFRQRIEQLTLFFFSYYFHVAFEKGLFYCEMKVNVFKETDAQRVYRFRKLNTSVPDDESDTKMILTKNQRSRIIHFIEQKCYLDQGHESENQRCVMYHKKDNETEMSVLSGTKFQQLLRIGNVLHLKSRIERLILSGMPYRIGQYIICSEATYRYLYL
jgi:hypothetical protein